ncbi:MAG TPA: hypothetical protein VFW08_09200 [bacterium]|nr:hypothetical protein [bacterium]
MTDEELLAAAAALGLRLDRRIARELAAEVERVREAAHRLRELPLEVDTTPFAGETDER